MYKDGKRLSPLNPNPFTGGIYIGSICPAEAPKTAPQGQKRLNLPRGEVRSDSGWDILILVDSALLIHDHIEVRSHKGAGLMFGQKYVIPGIFSADDGRLYAKLQDLREKSDYNLVYQSSEDEMVPLIEKTRVKVMFFYLNRRGANRRRYWRQLHQRWPRADS